MNKSKILLISGGGHCKLVIDVTEQEERYTIAGIIDKKELIGKYEEIFKAIESKDIKPKQGIFYNGQIFDAYTFISDIIKSAKKSIILIDNYIDESTLTILSKRDKIGASLKDLGKKWFAFSKMDIESFEMIGRLK